MKALLDQMEADISDGRHFLTGESYSLADVVGTAYCARIHLLKGTELFPPKVTHYWERMKNRPSFKTVNVCAVWEDVLMAKQFDAFVETLNTSG